MKNEKAKIEPSLEEKWCAALNYSIIGLLWYLFDKNMKQKHFVKYHAKQAIVILIIILMIELLMGLMPFLIPVWTALIIISFSFCMVGILHSLEGKEKPIPLIGQYASRIKI